MERSGALDVSENGPIYIEPSTKTAVPSFLRIDVDFQISILAIMERKMGVARMILNV